MKRIHKGLWFDGRRWAKPEVCDPGSAGSKRWRRTVPATTAEAIEASNATARRLLFASILYLPLIFALMVLDRA